MQSMTIERERAASRVRLDVIPTACICGGRMEWRAPFAVCAECGLAIPPRPVMTEQPDTNVRPMPAGQLTAGESEPQRKGR